MQTTESWMAVAYMAGSTVEEVADVVALSLLFEKPCSEIKGRIAQAQGIALQGAKVHATRFRDDLKRLADMTPPAEKPSVDGMITDEVMELIKEDVEQSSDPNDKPNA